MASRLIKLDKKNLNESALPKCAGMADCRKSLLTNRDQLICVQDEETPLGIVTIGPLEWESEFFKRSLGELRLFRAETPRIANDLLRAADEEARHLGFEHMHCRIISERYMESTALQDWGYRYYGSVAALQLEEGGLREGFAADCPNVRPAEEKDLGLALTISKGIYQRSFLYVDPFFVKDDVDGMHKAWIGNLFSNAENRVYVDEIEGQAAGYLAAEPREAGWEISLIAAAQEFRRKRVASRLINKLIQDLGDAAFPISASTQGHNYAAIGLYSEMGFHIYKHKVNFCKSSRQDRR